MHITRSNQVATSAVPRLRKTLALFALLALLAGFLAVVAEQLGLVQLPLWLASLSFVPSLLLLLVPRRYRTPEPPADEVVLDADGIRRLRGGQVLESVPWSKLVRVAIVTTDAGPFAEDFFWMLGADDGTGVAISGAQASRVHLLDRLGALPGFDHRAVIAASGSSEDALFVCWTGAPGDATAALALAPEPEAPRPIAR